MTKKTNKSFIIFISFSCLFFMLGVIILTCWNPIVTVIYQNYHAPVPMVESEWLSERTYTNKGDYYVSTLGNDDNDGSEQYPFYTINHAIEVAKTQQKDSVICLRRGTYHFDDLCIFNQNKTIKICAYQQEEVVISGAVKIRNQDFVKVDAYPQIAERLSSQAKEHVYVVDLSLPNYHLNEKDWGQLKSIGTYTTANRYADYQETPMYGELFVNGKRQQLAKYPNEGYLYTEKPISTGIEQNDSVGDIYMVGEELSKKISSWQKIQEVWAYGFWQYDWADSSTPIESFDHHKNRLSFRYQSFFGTKEGAPYYFYNCLEELDAPNEWYLDRENGLLCIYAQDIEHDVISFSTSLTPIVQINGSHVILDGLTIEGTRSNGIVINGHHNRIENCVIQDIAGNGVMVEGDNNTVFHNEIKNIGCEAVAVNGGDRTNLVSGNNVIDNNLIHNWAEVYRTYRAGVNLNGCGNICTHNELFQAPHLAITYSGNNHLIGYNDIHEVCLQTDDAGAIYAGCSWTAYGNVIRNNLIYDLETDEHRPNGIYMDDAISGQQIYDNILIDIPQYAIYIGGGRDMYVCNNLVVNAQKGAIHYDARARDGLLRTSWFENEIAYQKGTLWQDLYQSPYKSKTWETAFPCYQTMLYSIQQIEDAAFIANPANSLITNNLIVDKTASIGDIDDIVYQYSEIGQNITVTIGQAPSYFEKWKSGAYKIKEKRAIKEIKPFDLSNIGLY